MSREEMVKKNTNVELENQMIDMHKEVIEKFEKRHNKHKISIIDEGVKPSDIGMKSLVEHFREEVFEFIKLMELLKKRDKAEFKERMKEIRESVKEKLR